MITRVSVQPEILVRVGRRQWRRLIRELGRRGRGLSEAGAFLLANRGGDERTVTRVVYYDELDPNCLQGAIRFSGLAYSPLSDICDAEGRLVIADIHSHPYASVEQSTFDEESPMISREGHLSLIVPHLALRPVSTTQVGLHEYRGEAGWLSWTGDDAARRIKLGWWR